MCTIRIIYYGIEKIIQYNLQHGIGGGERGQDMQMEGENMNGDPTESTAWLGSSEVRCRWVVTT